eukprot:355717-Chlamydomonas_euryale.AAC.2
MVRTHISVQDRRPEVMQIRERGGELLRPRNQVGGLHTKRLRAQRAWRHVCWHFSYCVERCMGRRMEMLHPGDQVGGLQAKRVQAWQDPSDNTWTCSMQHQHGEQCMDQKNGLAAWISSMQHQHGEGHGAAAWNISMEWRTKRRMERRIERRIEQRHAAGACCGTKNGTEQHGVAHRVAHGVAHGAAHGVAHGAAHGVAHGAEHGVAHEAAHGETDPLLAPDLYI